MEAAPRPTLPAGPAGAGYFRSVSGLGNLPATAQTTVDPTAVAVGGATGPGRSGAVTRVGRRLGDG